jgi:hypothetical protein
VKLGVWILHCCDGIPNGLACGQGSREADCARQIAVGRSDGSPYTVEIKFWCVQKWIRE